MQKKRNFIILTTICLIIFCLTLIGCEGSINTKAIIPEPYKKMLTSISDGDLDMTEKYADLVIKDFADSDYVYNAYLIKNMIVSSKITLNGYKLNFLKNGIDQMNALGSESDLMKIKEYLTGLGDNIEKYQNDYDITAEYLLNNFQKAELIKLESPKAPENIDVLTENDFQGLEWFSKIGYPIPTEADISNDSERELKIFYHYNNGFPQDKDFSYAEYFYRISNISSTNDLNKRLLTKVVELTEDDQYNEFRIQAQDELSEM